jgi:pathogenesis-related protein 1
MNAAAARHNFSAQIAAYLEGHNIVRASHGAKPLTWSTSLAASAEKWADDCNLRHTNGVLSDKPYGENIVAATGRFPVHTAMGTFIEDAGKCFLHTPNFYPAMGMYLVPGFRGELDRVTRS